MPLLVAKKLKGPGLKAGVFCCLPSWVWSREMRKRSLILVFATVCLCSGCAVVAVADAAVSVVATGVKVGAAVVETTVDVAAAGVQAVAGTKKE